MCLKLQQNLPQNVNLLYHICHPRQYQDPVEMVEIKFGDPLLSLHVHAYNCLYFVNVSPPIDLFVIMLIHTYWLPTYIPINQHRVISFWPYFCPNYLDFTYTKLRKQLQVNLVFQCYLHVGGGLSLISVERYYTQTQKNITFRTIFPRK